MATSERVMMALGRFRFSVDTAAYQSLQQSQSWGWVEQSRVGNSPILQLTSRPLRTISLQGTIYPEYLNAKINSKINGYDQINQMRVEAEKGEPLPLVSVSYNLNSTGVILGMYVIMSISENHRVFRDDGSPRVMDFTLELREYIK